MSDYGFQAEMKEINADYDIPQISIEEAEVHNRSNYYINYIIRSSFFRLFSYHLFFKTKDYIMRN